MNRKKVVMVIIVLFLVVISWIVVQGVRGKGESLISPGAGKVVESVVGQPTPEPTVSSFNAPQEIKYGSATDLQEELDSINPQVLDSDFE